MSELVALASVNPAFLPPTHPRAGEQAIAKFIADRGAALGLEVDWLPVSPGRANVLLRLKPRSKSRQKVLLAPHLDTVNGADEQFTPRIRQGRLYGRGACDTKGSVAAMLGALFGLAQVGPRPQATEIVFSGLMDEENAQRGSRALVRSRFKADLAIVGEPTGLKAVTAHKGSLWLRIETSGRSAHGSRPELGRNAVHAMARIVDLLETEYATQLARRRHPLLGHATVSVGVISGGTQPNIVPDHCCISIDRRTLPGETEHGVLRELRGLLRKHGLAATCIGDKAAPCPPLETDARSGLVPAFLRSLGQRRPAGVYYFCDAAVLAEGGIPSVVFGPGDIAQAHTADEWVSLDQVEKARRKLTAFFRSLP
ncbi:MAG TPA: M20 family metallopeptidase [Verrucomicrobiae bacterium]|nr:M20 family metallopeptidase [Verrucomicrobiae bacterium]